MTIPSFNAPLPAALVGNMFNPNDEEEFVLGRFTASAAVTKSIFINRIFVEGTPLEGILITQAEEDEAPSPIVITAPCEEGRHRTSVRPDDWQD